MQSAFFHVERSVSQLARLALAPVHAAGRGQDSRGRLHARGRNLIPATKCPLFQTRNKTMRAVGETAHFFHAVVIDIEIFVTFSGAKIDSVGRKKSVWREKEGEDEAKKEYGIT